MPAGELCGSNVESPPDLPPPAGPRFFTGIVNFIPGGGTGVCGYGRGSSGQSLN